MTISLSKHNFSDIALALSTAFEKYGLTLPDINIGLAVIGGNRLGEALTGLGLTLVVNGYQCYLVTGTTDPVLRRHKVKALHGFIEEFCNDQPTTNNSRGR